MINATNPYAAYAGFSTYHAPVTTTPASTYLGTLQEPEAEASESSDATIISLSANARAALAKSTGSESLFAVTSRARDALDTLLADAKLTSPIKDGKVAVDLSGLDRRALFAISSNAGGNFSEDEQTAAAAELTSRFDGALAGPAAVARVTGDPTALYRAAQTFLEAGGTEEKATEVWAAAKAAVSEALGRLKINPKADLSDIGNDPVADYLANGDTSGTANLRDFDAVAEDARAFLDDLAANRPRLPGRGHTFDLSSMDGRSLAAISLNQGGQFSHEETRAAREESRSRVAKSLMDSMKLSDDPRALSIGMIGQYATMSAEERTALGWTDQFQQTAIENYQSTSNVLSILNNALAGAGGGGSMSGGLASFL